MRERFLEPIHIHHCLPSLPEVYITMSGVEHEKVTVHRASRDSARSITPASRRKAPPRAGEIATALKSVEASAMTLSSRLSRQRRKGGHMDQGRTFLLRVAARSFCFCMSPMYLLIAGDLGIKKEEPLMYICQFASTTILELIPLPS